MYAMQTIVEMQKELQAYKDAEEQGLLVRLPCKVGAPIYSVGMAVDECPCVDEFEVNSFEYCEDEAGNLELWVYCAIGFHFRSDAMGKTVFLTREEAEAALKEG